MADYFNPRRAQEGPPQMIAESGFPRMTGQINSNLDSARLAQLLPSQLSNVNRNKMMVNTMVAPWLPVHAQVPNVAPETGAIT